MFVTPRDAWLSGLVRWSKAIVARALVALLFMQSSYAHAQSSDASACVTHAELAQEFHKAGALTRARAEVELCTQLDCPEVVRADCQHWLTEWKTVEGAPSTVETDDVASNQRDEPAAPASKDRAQPKSLHSPSSNGGQEADAPIWPWFAAAAAVVGAGGFAYWGIQGRKDAAALREDCGYNKTCSNSQVDAVREKLIFADVSLGVGIVALGAALLGWATSPDTAVNDPTGAANNERPISWIAYVQPSVGVRSSSVTARFVF